MQKMVNSRRLNRRPPEQRKARPRGQSICLKLQRKLSAFPPEIDGRPVLFAVRNPSHKSEVFVTCPFCSRPKRDGGTGRKTIHRHGFPERHGKPEHRIGHCPTPVKQRFGSWGYYCVVVDDVDGLIYGEPGSHRHQTGGKCQVPHG